MGDNAKIENNNPVEDNAKIENNKPVDEKQETLGEYMNWREKQHEENKFVNQVQDSEQNLINNVYKKAIASHLALRLEAAKEALQRALDGCSKPVKKLWQRELKGETLYSGAYCAYAHGNFRAQKKSAKSIARRRVWRAEDGKYYVKKLITKGNKKTYRHVTDDENPSFGPFETILEAGFVALRIKDGMCYNVSKGLWC